MVGWEKHWDENASQENKLMSYCVDGWLSESVELGVDVAEENARNELHDFPDSVVIFHCENPGNNDQQHVPVKVHFVAPQVLPNHSK